MATETKQGLEAIIRFKKGACTGFNNGCADSCHLKYTPEAAGAADITFTYKRSVDWSWNYNVRPIHNHLGQVTHYKAGIGSGTLTLNSLYVDEGNLETLREAITGSSVPWGYMEVQFMDVDGAAVEFALKMRRIVLSERSNSTPDDDATMNLSFILFENPRKVLTADVKLTS